MTTRSFSLPLSRWHHVAARIKSLADGQAREARDALAGTELTAPVSEAQAEALRARGARGLDLLAQARVATDTVARIRAALATANATHGVTALLAEAEGVRAQARLLASFQSIDLTVATPLASANAVLESRTDSKGLLAMRGLRVALVEPTALDSLADERLVLESRAAALSDQVADLNRAVLSLELPVSLAQAAGLL